MTGKAKNMSGSRNKRKWRLIVLGALLGILSGASVISTQTPPPDNSAKKAGIIGTWFRRTFVYTFEDSVNFRVVRVGSRDMVRGRYAWFRLGEHDCLALWKAGADSGGVEVVLIGEMTDSTAIISLGTPFVRDGSGRGINGQWKHLEPFARMDWVFGVDRIQYRNTIYHPSNGEEQVLEARTGAYSRDGEIEPGSFTVRFSGGAQATVLPVVYRDMMYLFDLSPGKSYFRRGKASPPAMQSATETKKGT